MKVFTKKDLLVLNDGIDGLVEYENDEAFVNSLEPFGRTELYLGDVTVPPLFEDLMPDEDEDLPDYGKCTLSRVADPHTGELFLLIDKRFLVKDETTRLGYVDFYDAKSVEDGSRLYPDDGKSYIVPVLETLVDGNWTPDVKLMNAMIKDEEDIKRITKEKK